MAKFKLPALYCLPEHRQQPGRRVVLGQRRGILDRAGYLSFQLGTCHGALRAGLTAYELLAVANEQPGNGDFHQLMKHLIALARAHRRDLVIVEVKNAKLGERLRLKYAMSPVPGTHHFLLQVAGPGTCPAELLHTKPNSVLDSLLDSVTKQVADL